MTLLRLRILQLVFIALIYANHVQAASTHWITDKSTGFHKLSPKLRKTKVKVMGKGASGDVFQYILTDRKKRAVERGAVKLLTKKELTLIKSTNELEVAQLFSPHDNFVTTHSIVKHGDLFAIHMELGEDVNTSDPEFDDPDHALDFMKQLLQAFADMHAAGYVHRDIKIENILRIRSKDTTIYKVIDFGFSAKINAPEKNVGTLMLMPPNLLIGYFFVKNAKVRCNTKDDVYSLGSTFFEIFNILKKSYMEIANEHINRNRTQVLRKFLHYGRFQYEYVRENFIAPALKDHRLKILIMDMLHPDKNQRPNMSEALEMINSIIKQRKFIKRGKRRRRGYLSSISQKQRTTRI